jgi:hypothetical protein
MPSSTIHRLKRLALLGVLVGPVFWGLKKFLIELHVLRDTELAGGRQTLADHLLSVAWWDAASILLLGVAGCCLIVLYVIVAPPPRDG